MNLLEAAAALRSGGTTSAELTEACLERIGHLNLKLNAFFTETPHLAREQARRADRELADGVDRGPLHGIPVAYKDLIYTKGIRTTAGSSIFRGFEPSFDAAVVERLREAGAVMVGKTGTHEIAYGITCDNPHFGAIRNPWDEERSPGGSSGGSGCAVASGMAMAALGTDTGGSVRIPASWCGVVGFKPTFGAVSRHGVFPLGFTLDHIGPLTRTVRDAAAVMGVLAGKDPRDEATLFAPALDFRLPADGSLDGLRVGRPSSFFFDALDDDVRAAVEKMFELAKECGAEVVSVALPDMEALNLTARTILFAEASAAYDGYKDRISDFGEDVRALLLEGWLLAATDYVNAQRLRRLFCDQFAEIWREVDCLFTPCTPMPAPKFGQNEVTLGRGSENVRLAATRLVRGFNLLGAPALALPCGYSAQPLPLSLQIVGPPGSDALVLRVGAALEDRLPAAGIDLPER